MSCCPMWEVHVVSTEAVPGCTQNTLQASELAGQLLPNNCPTSTLTSEQEYTSHQRKLNC